MKNVKYLKFAMQEYLQSDIFNHDEKKLFFSLRSMCYPTKMNFNKINRGNLDCVFRCNAPETQTHIF